MACSSVIRTLATQIKRSVRFDPEQPLNFFVVLTHLISCFRQALSCEKLVNVEESRTALANSCYVQCKEPLARVAQEAF